MPTMYLPSSSKKLATIPFNQNALRLNIYNQPQSEDEEIRHLSFMRKLFPNVMEEFHSHYTTEQLLITIFSWVMISTSHSHAVLGFELLEKTGLSSSVSPIVMSLFKYFFAIFASLSTVDVYYSPLKTSFILRKGGLFGVGFGIPLAHFLTPIKGKYRGSIVYIVSDILYMSCTGGFSSGHGKHGWIVNFGVYWLLHITVFPIGVRINLSSELVIIISILTSFSWAASSHLVVLTSSASLFYFLDKRIKNLLPVASSRVKSTLKEKKKVLKFVKYAIGLLGTLLFQNFFRLTTFDHVRAFMYLATSLIATSHDFGILNFIIGNMILGSTVSQSGLGIITWFTYCVCVFLYILNFMLKPMKNSRDLSKLSRPPFIFWVFYCCTIFDWVSNLMHQI